MENFSYEDLKMLILEHCGNDNPNIFVDFNGNIIDYKVFIDEDSDIIIKI